VRSLLGLCLLLLTTSAVADGLTFKQETLLKKGEVILLDRSSDNRRGKTFEVYALIPATLDQVYSVLSKFSEYAEFMPNLKRVVVERQDIKSAVLAYFLSLPAGMKKQYRLEMSYSRTADSARLSWVMLPSPGVAPEDTIAATEGYWDLTTHNGKVLARYYVYTDPGEVPFGFGWVVDYMSSKSILAVVANTRDRVIQNSKQL